jgi:hypothetical protein
MKRLGISSTQIAREMSCCRQTVYNIYKSFIENPELGGESKRRNCKGVKKTTAAEDRAIFDFSDSNPEAKVNDIWAAVNPNTTTRTVCNRLLSAGLHSRVCKRVEKLTDRHKQSRIEFAGNIDIQMH